MGIDGHLEPLSGIPLNGKPPEGTVPQGVKINVPIRIDYALIQKGQQQYNIYCLPCHGASGNGNGMIVQRGFPAPTSFHTERLRKESDQHYFQTITHGSGKMYSFSDRISEASRWSIIAYIRALQFSQNAAWSQLPAEDQQNLKER